MATNSPQTKTKGRDRAVSTLNGLINILNIAKDACAIKPARVAFGSVSGLLATIRDIAADKKEYVDIGSTCANVCKVLDRGLNGKRLEELSQAVIEAIQELTTTVSEIQKKVVEQGNRNVVSRFFHAMSDRGAIAGWKQDLLLILQVFNTELSVNNHVALLDIRRDVQAIRGGADNQHQSTQASILVGEVPPPKPRACFGRDGLIEKIVGLAETLNPVALIGPGGIGKTSLALAVLHHDRVKDRFGSNRPFIRCDEFPASRASFLRRLSKAIGAGIDNPEGLVSLRSFLSSEEMFIVLDNAESILDPQGTDASDIYRVMEELSQFGNICLCITSRITTLPPNCETLKIPTLPVEAARDAFYGIYKHGGRSDAVNDILKQLDFHSLSVTLLATVAHQNKWNNSRLAREWERRQTGVLQTEHNNSLAATIELSLASPMFRELVPDARELLRVIAFFPQGVDENNLNWLFPAIPNIGVIFNKLCILSLVYRSGDFVTMLAPLRDHFRPTSPTLSPLLHSTKELYFTRLSVDVDPDVPTSQETRWIALEDVNVERLLDVCTSTDTNSEDVWDACTNFIAHLHWHKQRQTILRPKIERLPDDHPSKAGCLFQLSRLMGSMGNTAEQKPLLFHVLALHKKEGNDYEIGRTLLDLSQANWMLGLREDGIPQAEEALGIMERVGGTPDQARCLNALASLLLENGQLDSAQDAASRAVRLLGEGQELEICRSHRILGSIYSSQGEGKKAIHHYEVALGIAASSGWRKPMASIHHSMAQLFLGEDMLDDAEAHIMQAKLCTDDNTYPFGRVTEMQALIWYSQKRLEDATSEASLACEIFEKLGAATDLERCRAFLQRIERATES